MNMYDKGTFNFLGYVVRGKEGSFTRKASTFVAFFICFYVILGVPSFLVGLAGTLFFNEDPMQIFWFFLPAIIIFMISWGLPEKEV